MNPAVTLAAPLPTCVAFQPCSRTFSEHCQTEVLLPLFGCAEPILLDGLLQAVTLKTGDVVAVRSAARPLPTHFGCFEHQMQLNPKNIHRPVLSSLLQVGTLRMHELRQPVCRYCSCCQQDQTVSCLCKQSVVS
jgi:hypothetical protein